jgi:hypothetical protein
MKDGTRRKDPNMFQCGFRTTLRQIVRELLICVALPSMVLVSAKMVAQQPSAPATQQRTDDQISNDIHTKLLASAELRPLALGVWVQNGMVTLSGAVPTDALRQKADALVWSVPGVKALQDQLSISTTGSAAETQSGQSSQAAPPPPGPPPPPPTAEQLAEPPTGPSPNADSGENPSPQAQQTQPSYPEENPAQEPNESPEQAANQPMVTLAAGTPLYVMMQQTVDSKHTQPGDRFRAVVVQDVAAGNGAIAIPRGAYVDGVVIDARPAGKLKGRPKLVLRFTNLDIGPASYGLVNSSWSAQGPGKGGNTAATVAGTTAFGAITGGIIGGGPSALLGGVLGGLGGAGLSALSSGPRLLIPAESVITVHLGAALDVRQPTRGEMRVLRNNLPPPRYGYGQYPPQPYGYPYSAPPPPPMPGAPPGGYPY